MDCVHLADNVKVVIDHIDDNKITKKFECSGNSKLFTVVIGSVWIAGREFS